MNEMMTKLLNAMKSEIINEIMEKVINHFEGLMANNKEFYTLKEVSHITGLTERQIKNRYRNGTIKHIYDGGTPLIPSIELEKLLNKLKKQM